jgi:hypothetical protein
MADRDSRNRATIEQAVERTAVGDRVFFPLQGGPRLLIENTPLVLAEAPELKPEASMLLIEYTGRLTRFQGFFRNPLVAAV